MEIGKLIIGTVGSIFVVSACRYWFRYSAFLRRTSLDREELYKIFSVRGEKQKFDKILEKVSELYGVPSSKLRPSDSFRGNLRALDSWNLGSGAEELESSICKLINVEKQQESGSVHSLGDLVNVLEPDRPL